MGVFGKEFSGSDGDNSYILFCSFFAFISLLIIYWDFLQNEIKFTRIELLLLFSPIIIIALFFFERPIIEQARKMFMQYLIWGIPALSIGIYIGKKNSLEKIIIPLLVCAIFLLFGLCRTWLFNLSGIIRESTSGESYQVASYSAAICFSIFIYAFLFKKFIPILITKYRILLLPLMFICLIIIFLTGGRGGMVLTIVSTLVFLFLYQKKNKISLQTKTITALCIGLGILILIIYIQHNPILSETSHRVFSYISEDGIDMSQTSHRDEAYNRALLHISQAPLLGYGFFKYFDINNNYPHNFFLELLLQGGISYIIVFIIISILYFRKLRLMLQTADKNIILLIVLLYSLVRLMFSGSYISTGTFWFSLTYVATYKFGNDIYYNYFRNNSITYKK